MNSKGNYKACFDLEKANREEEMFYTITKRADDIVKSLKNNGTGKTRNKLTHLQPKKKKRK